MGPVRDEVLAVLGRLPVDATLEDVQYALYVVDKIRRGLADADAGRTLTPAEVDRRLARWLS